MSQKNIKAMPMAGSSRYDPRYVIIDADTGEILDDAQGYGYKSQQKAHAAYAYKNRDKSKDQEKKARRAEVRKWAKEHKGFLRDMDQYCFEIEFKGSWGPDDRFDAKFVKRMLDDYGFKDLPFTASQLLQYWKSGWKP